MGVVFVVIGDMSP